MMKARAEYLRERLGKDNIKCWDGWFARFKNRQGISLHKLSGESSSVDVNDVEGLAPVLKAYLDNYSPCDIYYTDEMGVYFNLLPHKTLATRTDPCKGGKKSKDRATVLLCANMDGSDTLKPFMVGKFAHSQCFKKV